MIINLRATKETSDLSYRKNINKTVISWKYLIICYNELLLMYVPALILNYPLY